MFSSFNARALGLSLDADTTIDLARRAGFEGVDLLVRDLVESGRDPASLRSRMGDLGLRGGAWPLPVHWRGDRDRFEADLRALPRLADVAARLGLLRTGTWVLPALPAADDRTTDAPCHDARALLDWHVARLGPILRLLDERGIRLGLEVIGIERARAGQGAPFVHRLDDLEELLSALESVGRGAGLLVDLFHMHAAGESQPAILRRRAGCVVWVHVADVGRSGDQERSRLEDHQRGLPGESDLVDVRGGLEMLEHLGYDGPVTVETFACESLAGITPEAAAHRAAWALGRCWPRAR